MLRPEEREVTGLDVTRREHPHLKVEIGEAPCKAPQGEPSGSLQKRL